MRKILFALFIVLIFFVGCVQTQRGRSRSRSRRSRSSFGSRRRSRFSRWWVDDDNITYCNQTVTTNCVDPYSGTNILTLALGIFALFGVQICSFLIPKTTVDKGRDEQINKIFDQFEYMNSETSHGVDEAQKAKARDWFMSNKWKMKFKLKNGGSFKDVDVKLDNIKNRTESSYEITMIMTDYIGKSRARGILMHKQDHLIIKFQKTYDNRSNAGQTGNFSILLYEGHQEGEQFAGQWAYKGYEYSPLNSGTWRMYHI